LSSSASDEESDSADVSGSDDETSDGKEVEPKPIAATLKQSQRLDRAVNSASESAISEESDTSESEITDDSDAASTDDSEYSSEGYDGDNRKGVENLLALDTSTPKIDNTTIESSISHGLEGLVMAPLIHDYSSSAHQGEDLERDSGAWKRLVRHELGGGLEVSYRYLRGLSSGKQAKLLSLTESAIIVQLKFENRRSDFGTLRHIRVVQRNGGQGGPKKVAVPPEIAALGKNQFSLAILGIDFGNPTSDRDGCWVARMDIKSDRGTNPVEFRPTLAEILTPLSLNGTNFEKVASKFTGSYQKMSFLFTLDPSHCSRLPRHLMKHANLGAVDNELNLIEGAVRFGASLPFSGDYVLVLVKCNTISGASELVIYCDNAIASTSIMDTLKRAISLCEQ